MSASFRKPGKQLIRICITDFLTSSSPVNLPKAFIILFNTTTVSIIPQNRFNFRVESEVIDQNSQLKIERLWVQILVVPGSPECEVHM